MGAMASQITDVPIVYSTVCSGAYQTSKLRASLAFVRGIHRWPVNSAHKGPVTRKMFSFDDVIMGQLRLRLWTWWHRAITRTNADYSSMGSSCFTSGQFDQKMSINETCLKLRFIFAITPTSHRGQRFNLLWILCCVFMRRTLVTDINETSWSSYN